MAADYLLFLFLSCRNKSETIGDLTEEFHEDIMPAFGLKAARFRCWKKALSAIVERNPIVREFLIGGGVLKAGEVIWKLFAGQQAWAAGRTWNACVVTGAGVVRNPPFRAEFAVISRRTYSAIGGTRRCQSCPAW